MYTHTYTYRLLPREQGALPGHLRRPADGPDEH